MCNYIVNTPKAFWGKGYATEAAIASREYAFTKLNAPEVYSIIRDTNIPSLNVAKRNGMSVLGRFTKYYRGVEMPHLLFSVKAEAGRGRKSDATLAEITAANNRTKR